MNTHDRTITFDEINEESFKEGYKKAFREICELEQKGYTGYKIEILFDEEGNWSGHTWQANSFYSVSDLECNRDFKLEYTPLALEELIEEWKDEVREDLI